MACIAARATTSIHSFSTLRQNGLAKHLRTKDWAAFALGYNGKDYKINHYHTKLAAAYKQHRG